jgi:NADH-quinone oxidoreductase subunit L
MNSALPWIILLAPLVSAVVITLFTQRARDLSGMIAVAAALLSFIASCIVFAQPNPTAQNQIPWLAIGGFQVPIGITIDQLSKAMLLIVTGVGSLIHIYSLGYMSDDEGKSRYFAGLSIFMFSMLGIVLANNLVMMFVFWELVGLSSYILIGHWFYRDAPAAAANKAFITNRLGDFGFMLGILLLWTSLGTIDFAKLKAIFDVATAGMATADPLVQKGAAALAALSPAFLGFTVLCIFCGAVGKSAQFPLHVWLPDAMEGPTPVSALIHAATMVAAGVYMLARVFFLVAASPLAQNVIAWIGIITAVLAALMATQQSDIKRILAYSTLSQLGYMVMAIGLAADKAAMFHLFTHASFKALLFLGAGSVIHAMHHEQNIWKMGSLKNHMPWTFITFAIGTLALTGCPGFSGFFSKDAILAAAHENTHVLGARLIFVLALLTAFLTAFYMARLFIVVFLGKPHSHEAIHGHESPPVMTLPLVLLAVPSVFAGYAFFGGKILPLPVEEHASQLVPALAFAAFALGTGIAWALYHRRDEDPITIPLFARKFYFDETYAFLIRWTHDLAAMLSAWFDRWILDGALIRTVCAGGTWGTGFVLRFLQVGNLQAYAFLSGLGVIGLIYFVVFK